MPLGFSLPNRRAQHHRGMFCLRLAMMTWRETRMMNQVKIGRGWLWLCTTVQSCTSKLAGSLGTSSLHMGSILFFKSDSDSHVFLKVSIELCQGLRSTFVFVWWCNVSVYQCFLLCLSLKKDGSEICDRGHSGSVVEQFKFLTKRNQSTVALGTRRYCNVNACKLQYVKLLYVATCDLYIRQRYILATACTGLGTANYCMRLGHTMVATTDWFIRTLLTFLVTVYNVRGMLHEEQCCKDIDIYPWSFKQVRYCRGNWSAAQCIMNHEALPFYRLKRRQSH